MNRNTFGKVYSRQAIQTVVAAAFMVSSSVSASDWFPYPVEVWEPAFNMKSPRTQQAYQPVAKADRAWDICVSFPHLKDAYWTSVNYGIVDEARRTGVKVQLVEAGGYTNLNNQISQIEDCVSAGADAVVIGAISYDGLNNLVKSLTQKVFRLSTSSTVCHHRN